MKTLLLMRHAKSSWADGSLSDHERPLNQRGIESAEKMGRLLAELDQIPDVILSSTSKRTKQTIEYFLAGCPFSGEIFYTRSLYHGGPEEIISSLQKWGGDFSRVMVVGHNPGMEYAVDEFTGENERMVTGAIAQISYEIDRWQDISENMGGSLVNFWQPREID